MFDRGRVEQLLESGELKHLIGRMTIRRITLDEIELAVKWGEEKWSRTNNSSLLTVTRGVSKRFPELRKVAGLTVVIDDYGIPKTVFYDCRDERGGVAHPKFRV